MGAPLWLSRVQVVSGVKDGQCDYAHYHYTAKRQLVGVAFVIDAQGFALQAVVGPYNLAHGIDGLVLRLVIRPGDQFRHQAHRDELDADDDEQDC